MDDVAWKELIARFPQVPARFRMELVETRTPVGQPIVAHERPVIALAFSHDSRTIAASGGGTIPGPAAIRVFDVESRTLTRICHGHTMGVLALAFDPRTGLLGSASHDYSVILWELERREAVFLVGGPDAGISRSSVAFVDTRVVIGDGMTFAGARARLHAIDLTTGAHSALLAFDRDRGVGRMASVPGALVVTIDDPRGGSTHELRVLAPDGTQISATPVEQSIYDVAAVDAQRVIVSGSDRDGNTDVRVINGAARVLGDEIGAYLAGSPAGDLVAVGYADRIEVCDAATLAARTQLRVGARVCSVAWSPDGRWIAAGTLKKTLHLFDAATGREHLG